MRCSFAVEGFFQSELFDGFDDKTESLTFHCRLSLSLLQRLKLLCSCSEA